jgi:putative PIN family toxin of toxin-antitoxin system
VKVVIDTNIVVSAALKDRLPEELILFIVGHSEFEWIGTTEIVKEYNSVLSRTKLGLPQETIQKWADTFERRVVLVEADKVIDFPRDQKDAKFIACALSSNAEYLITGDKDFEDAYKMGVTTVISVAEFKRLVIEEWE